MRFFWYTLFLLVAAFWAGFILSVFGVLPAPAQEAPAIDMHPAYVTVIVLACPASVGVKSGEVVVVPDNEQPSADPPHLTRPEMVAKLLSQGCKYVPVPPDHIKGDMTLKDCMAMKGYLVSMQYLQAEQEYKIDFPLVGSWECVSGGEEPTGIVAQ